MFAVSLFVLLLLLLALLSNHILSLLMFLVSDVQLSCLSHVKLRGGTRGQETERTHLEGWATENFHLSPQFFPLGSCGCEAIHTGHTFCLLQPSRSFQEAFEGENEHIKLTY